MHCICVRLHRGDDLLKSLQRVCREHALPAAAVVSGVGCLSVARIRDASGVTVRSLEEPLEIVSLNGTAGAARTHVHIALAKEDLCVVGGHLTEGCIVNTTCELVLLPLDGTRLEAAFDPETGYNEVVFVPTADAAAIPSEEAKKDA